MDEHATDPELSKRLATYKELFAEIKNIVVEAVSKLKDIDDAANKALVASFALIAFSLFKLQVIEQLDKVPIWVATAFLVAFGVYALLGLILAWMPARMRYMLDLKPKLDYVVSLFDEAQRSVMSDFEDKTKHYESEIAKLKVAQAAAKTKAHERELLINMRDQTARTLKDMEVLHARVSKLLETMKVEMKGLLRARNLYRARMWLVFIGPLLILIASFILLLVRPTIGETN
jgi:hypothetical protein